MAEEKDTEFKFRIDEESPDAALENEAQPTRRGKPAQKSNLFLPLAVTFLLAVLCVLGYLDLRKRLTLDQSFDAQSAEGLAADVQSKFDAINDRTEELDASFREADKATQKTLESLKFRLHKADYRIKKINETMVDKETQQKDHQALMTRLSQLDDQFEAMGENVNQKMADLTGSVKNSRIDLTQVKADLGAKADQKRVDQIMAEERKRLQKNLQALERDLAARLNKLQQEMTQTQKLIRSLEAKQKQTPPPTQPSKPPAKPSGDSGVSPQPSENIIEKDI